TDDRVVDLDRSRRLERRHVLHGENERVTDAKDITVLELLRFHALAVDERSVPASEIFDLQIRRDANVRTRHAIVELERAGERAASEDDILVDARRNERGFAHRKNQNETRRGRLRAFVSRVLALAGLDGFLGHEDRSIARHKDTWCR